VADQPDAEAGDTATRTLTAEFTRPFLAHASVAPSCAIARWDGGSVIGGQEDRPVAALAKT
jgi:hypothetical protein